MSNLRVLISREQIKQRVIELGAAITRDFANQAIVFVGVLKGATIFLSDLARNVHVDATFDFIAVSSYGNETKPIGEVRLNKDVDQPLAGKNVILVEDILDTGLTLNFLKTIFEAHQPKSLRFAVLLDKVPRRTHPIHVHYCGFEIPDEFVVGYGMDYAEQYRNIPDICVLDLAKEQ
jgi:hypoxanthine phosphoribosyltransferase